MSQPIQTTPLLGLSVPALRRFALLLLLSVCLAVPYSIPPLGDWLLGRAPGSSLFLQRAVDNMLFFIVSSGLAAMVLAGLIFALRPPARIPQNGIIGLMMGLGAAVLLSLAWTSGLDFNPRTLLLPLCMGAGFCLILLASPTPRQVRSFVILLTVSAVPVALYAVLQSQGYEFLPYSQTLPGSTEEVSGKQLVASTFGHPNYLASYLVPLLPFAMWMVVAPIHVTLRAAGALTVAALTAGMLVGGTRGAWLAVLVSIVPFYLVTVLSPRYRRPLLFTGGLIGVVAFFLLLIPNPFVRVQYDVMDRLLASKEIVTRLYYWTIALQIWSENTLLGAGYGNYNVRFWDTVAAFQTKPGSEYYQYVLAEMIRGVPPQFVHNDHLQVLAEGGLLGASLWLGLWATLVGQFVQAAQALRHRAPDLLLVAAFAAAFAGMATDGLTNFPFHIPASGFLFYVLLGLWVSFRSHALGLWTSTSRPLPAARAADQLLPELPRVRPPAAIRRSA